ncbi:MAG: hypothetical protein IPQ07_37575 [Myxococcales bacterium]|nr:hypothetical protein [Myxococcales bacterium]
MQLPLFVVHGAVVWKLALVALTAVALGLNQLRRQRTARKKAAEDLKFRLGTVTPLASGPVVVRGTITKGSITAVVTGEGSTAERSDELWIDQHGENIAITGPVTLGHGTSNKPGFLARNNTIGVKTGDEVVIAGVAEPRAEDNVAYRESGIGWQLAADASVWAVTPQARPRPLGPISTAGLALCFALVGYGALRIVGSRALKHAKGEDRGVQRTLDNSDALSIAAAMPGSRDEALERIASRFRYDFVHTEDAFQLRLQLDELQGNCAAPALFESVRLDEALASARACGDHVLASQALAFLGRYEEAWNEPGRDSQPFFTGTVAIATGRWREAASAAEAVAEEQSKREPRSFFTEADVRAQALKTRCLAALFRGLGGEADPVAKVPGSEADGFCQLSKALLLPEADQAAALAAIETKVSGDYALASFVDPLRVVAGDPTLPWDMDRANLADLVGFGFQPTWWLSPFEVAAMRPDADPEIRDALLGKTAALLAFRGDLAGARKANADRKGTESSAHYDYSVELALALLDGASPFPAKHAGYIHPAIERMAQVRWGEPTDPDRLLGVVSEECKARLPKAFAAAQRGDGAELAAVFRDCNVFWNSLQNYVLAVAPMVKTHREELAAAIRLFRSDISTYSLEHIPFRFLGDVAMYRDLARAIGDVSSAAAWQKLFDQHLPVVQDRKKLIALLLWTR